MSEAKLNSNDLLNCDELSVVDHLATAWNEFLALEELHTDDVHEFRKAIHDAQKIVMARPVQKQFNDQGL